MTEHGHDITRRTLLGAVGSISGATALGGAGSFAYFSDEEEFANNRLVAGNLDLKVDWQEYYSDWSADEEAVVDDILMPSGPGSTLQDGEYPADYTGLPTPDNALVAIPDEDVQAFLDAAALEAYPDVEDGGTVSYPDGYDVCVHGADTPEDLDPTVDPDLTDPSTFQTTGTGLRTNNADTYGDEGISPLVQVEDVKPGDFGEVTISAHLCDNDGYLALTGEALSDAENGTTEPERKDPDEDGPTTGELADLIRVSVWYDGVSTDDAGVDENLGVDDPAGNNLLDDGEVLIEEGSLSAFLDTASTDRGIALNPAAGGVAPAQLSLTCEPNAGTITQPGSDGIEAGQSVTFGDPDDPDAATITIDEVNSSEETFFDFETFNYSFDGPESVGAGNYVGVCGLEMHGSDGTVTKDYGPGGCVRNAVFLPRQDVGTVESVTFDLCYYESPGGLGEPGEACFDASNTYYVGFAWWLPVDHANEAQTDSVSFDLGFYAEQCRHNDGLAVDGTG
jgi:predicted ribosomally synthesized peptide with SipW-like signal peptide